MPAPRYLAIDALRGFAMVWMTVYHLCFDLNHFGWIRQHMLTDPVWTVQRTLIVSLFLFCAGMGQAVALEQAPGAGRFSWLFWRRWAQVAGAALLVSLGSWWMFPQSYIYFGVLHGIALMLVLLRCVAGMGQGVWLLGCACIAMPLIAQYAHQTSQQWVFLNTKWLNWLGLVAYKPLTQDYVPVLPWLGVMCWGFGAGRWILQARAHWLTRAWLGGSISTPLAGLGRWSLSYYLLHQPVLMGLMAGGAWCLGA